MFVSEIKTVPPVTFQTPLQRKVYLTLETLGVSFERVETDPAVTMEDCKEINRKLDMDMVKTLFLCNRQQTRFYLLVTPGDKPFQAKEFSRAMDIPRVSFAPEALLERMLGVTIGAATIFSAILDTDNEIEVVLDKNVASTEWYGCSDGTVTGYMKFRTEDILHTFLPHACHEPAIIEIE